MLAAIFVIGLTTGIALLVLGRIRNGDELWGGIVLIFGFGTCIVVWLILYTISCMTVADLETFWKAERYNYEEIIQSYVKGINWLSEETRIYDLVAMSKTFSDYIKEVKHYNSELGRLRSFNNNIWLDPLFRDVPEELEYIRLTEKK